MASQSQAHLQIFTPDQAPKKEYYKFHLFPQLAKELREKIWMHALQHPRIIHLTLYDPDYPPSTGNNAEGTTEFPKNRESFWAIADGHQTISKLFRVNSDSREAALTFYHIRFLCKLRTIGGFVKCGIIYFNPENDFLRITSNWSVKHTLFNFMYHLKNTYDRRGIGLLNLVVTTNDITGNVLLLTNPSVPELKGRGIMAFKQIMKNIRKIIFYSTIRAGRLILGPHSGVLTRDIIYNRSFQIKAKAPIFDRLSRDPRTISEDLKQVYIGMGDNRDHIHLWHRLRKEWDIIPTPEIEYKWHIAFTPPETELILDRKSANEFMLREEIAWHGEDPVTPHSSKTFGRGPQVSHWSREREVQERGSGDCCEACLWLLVVLH
ncbi:hypothetical protein VHEMI09067 [[Torrubiella] hemipterigena]|uniref:2EXR domain-containing protein n=1 Tax=[Torrubiella] hemipterigena TaxID=1531966 RepID=A0A0A1TFC9_9HYPO|nr:hypothetical protein VHEMI09067 [[Torrubiella] hemipterigena]